MVRPRPFPRAHKREVSGGLIGTKYSPQSKVQKMREGARMNTRLLGVGQPVYPCIGRKTIDVGYWRWLGPPTPQFCVTHTNMLVSKNAKKKLASPNAKPQRETMEYRLCWAPNCNILALCMYISCCLCQFHLSLVANANAVFSGIGG